MGEWCSGLSISTYHAGGLREERMFDKGDHAGDKRGLTTSTHNDGYIHRVIHFRAKTSKSR